ncbi:MAG: leucine-rich repeat domain-containing protein [Monoglobales bacterium]
MKKMCLKIFILLCMGLLFAPVFVSAQSSGTCGDNVTWTLDNNGTLTISGTGAMKDYYNSPFDENSVKNVIIMNGITSVGDSSFEGCLRLSSISLPESVTSIGMAAFSGCKSLTSIDILSNVTSIEASAFENCSSLTNITIPNSVTSIGNYAFTGCNSLKNIEVSNDNVNYSSEDGVLFNKYKTTILCYPGGKAGDYVIPDTVLTIGNSAFSGCSSLSKIDIPSSVTTIESNSFADCSGLTNIDIPESVTIIERSAFSDCTSLTNITIPANVTSIENGTFSNCTSLVSIELSENITSIGSNEYFGSGPFSNCIDLTNITIPGSVVYIKKDTFNGCRSLVSIDVSVNNTNYSSQDGVLFDKDKTRIITYPQSKAGDYVIPSGVTSIGFATFNNCNNLVNITIPDSVTEIDDETFDSCCNLMNINVSANNENYSSQDGVLFNKDKTELVKYPSGKIGDYVIPSGVTSIGGFAFYLCTGLTNVTFPDSVTNIGFEAFEYCTGLTNITLPENITSIGWCAFANCNKLKSIIIPDSVTEIGYSAFSGCSSLTEVNIPNNMVKIDLYTFYDCTSLASINIPDNVTSIARYAFKGCQNLQRIVIPDGVTSLGEDAFENCSSLRNITVSEGNTAYASVEGVLYNKNKTKLIQYPCGRSGDYYLPDSVNEIASGAFDNCSGLTGIYVSENNADYSSDGGVLYNKELTRLIRYPEGKAGEYIMPDSITDMYVYAFRKCTKLTGISVSANNTTYASENGVLFNKYKTKLIRYPCGKAGDFTVSDSVTEINGSAFQNCIALTGIHVSENNLAYASEDGVLFNKDKTELLKYPSGKTGTYIIPDSVTEISSVFSAFDESANVISVVIHDNINRAISVFAGCENLSDIYYEGSKYDWLHISSGTNGDTLPNATMHFESTGFPVPQMAAEVISNEDGYIFDIDLKDVPYNCQLITALYDENGALAGKKITTITSSDTEKTITVPAENAVTAKVFIWGSLSLSEPLCDAVEIPVQPSTINEL